MGLVIVFLSPLGLDLLVWVPLADRPRLAALLGRGWAAVAAETAAGQVALGLCPL